MSRKLLATTFALSALLAACDQTTGPADVAETAVPFLPPSSPAVVIPDIATSQVSVCAEGDPGTYTFSVAGSGNDLTFTAAVDGSGHFTVDDDQCKLIVTAGTLGSVSVTLLSGPGVFAESETYRWHISGGPSGPPTSQGVTSNNPVTLSPYSDDYGWVAVFRSDPEVVIEPGCSLTQGYWKNHSSEWDDSGENAASFLAGDQFYDSGLTYLEIMNTAPKGGNAYIQLAHQFIAASLNVSGPTGIQAFDDALSGAAAYFASSVGLPNPTGAERTMLQGWASTLASYNEGDIGPGHCED